MNVKECALAVAATLMLTAPASGHHSDAGVDMKAVVAFAGTVREVAWRNPHVYFLVDTEQSGTRVTWELQMGPISVLARRGWARDTLKPGDKVNVRTHPATGGRPYGILESVDKEGGLRLTATAPAPAVPPPAKTLAGKWLTDRTSVLDFPAGSFDDFFRASLSLTGKGKAAQAAYDPLSAENPEASCVGRPTPAALVSSGLYLMEIDLTQQQKVVTVRSEAFNEVRTIYMDGRRHPAPSERFATGHSIGRWDGQTLVVDTANFTDHRSPYQIGVPSGGRKHVVERYRLTPDGTHIDLEFMLEDPDYLTKPMMHRRQLIHSPHLEMFFGECDPKATSRFVAKKP